ncbi:MAG TPA: PadR family transcriptional regulator [Propionibacteriaceae bacterium]|nr:PadR family transcriptional regulator [Propionibacteriaceae bacterium]
MVNDASQFRRGVLELAILALLRDAELYGAEIIDRLRGTDGLSAGAGTVYPLLSRLGRSNLVHSTWRESPVGPPRKYYRLTPAGQRVLADLAHDWRGMSRALGSLLEGVGQ